MTSLASNHGNKRKKRDYGIDNNEHEEHDQNCIIENREVEYMETSSINSTSFMEFRKSTIYEYPSLNWLGPGVMAVYWFKTYLKNPPFNWIRCPKKQETATLLSCSNRKRRKRGDLRDQNNSKGNFYFIPGQYLQNAEKKYDTNVTAYDNLICNILALGTPGNHFATSYIGVYNLLRSYGKFAMKNQCHNSKNYGLAPTEQQSASLHKMSSKIVPYEYNGPPLNL